MSPDEVLQLFRDTGALLDGHFSYASGRHGSQFLQAARVVQHPQHNEGLCQAMAEIHGDSGIELVVGPATGGIILAYETARHLNARAAFTEKDGEGGMALKRGFMLHPGTRVLVVEDIVTTGGSVQKTVDHLRERGTDVAGIVIFIDRSAGQAKFDCPFASLAQITMESWAPEECPLCKAGKAVIDPDDIVLDA